MAGAYAQTPVSLYLEIVINGLPSERIIEVRMEGERLYAGRQDLLDAGVRLPEDGSDPVALDDVARISAHYVQSTQQLSLTVPEDWLPEQRLGRRQVEDYLPASSSFGGLFNYDVYYSDASRGASYVSAWNEQRLFGGFGVLSNSGIYREALKGPGGAHDGYRRYDTTWRYNDQQRLQGYAAGDLITGALSWNNAVRMGGVQLSRNFGLRPDLITYPLPQFSGTASLPSTVDLFIDSARQTGGQLNPGPFTLDTVPGLNGAGQATVVTTDALGRRQATTVPFYVTNTLLRPGFSDYSLSLGSIRRDYGQRDFGYGRLATSATWRRGLTPWFTLESHAEAASDLVQAGLGATIALGNAGTLTTSVSQSHFEGSGQQYSLGYSYFSRRYGVSFQRVQRTAGFSDLSTLSALDEYGLGRYLARRTDQAAFSVSPGNLGTFGVGYFATQSPQAAKTRLVNLSWSRSIRGDSSLYLSLNRLLETGETSMQLQLIVPFDTHSTISTGVDRSSNGDYRARVNYTHTVPSDGGLGWSLGYADGEGSPYQQADITWRTQKAQIQGGLYRESSRQTQWANVSGSFIAMGGDVYATNRVNDAFVLVSTDDYSDVPIRFEHQVVGRTDRRGRLLIPWVPSYYRGQFEADLLDLPSNVTTDDTQRIVSVHQNSGAYLSFGLKRELTANIALVDEAGAALPRGTRVLERHSGQQALVGWDGLVYFAHLQPDAELRVELGDGQSCELAFALDAASEEMEQIGPLTCKGVLGGDET
jgi:outer membrane usher protein